MVLVYNQLMDFCNTYKSENCRKNVRDTMGNDNFPPTAADIFESAIEARWNVIKNLLFVSRIRLFGK